jgi:hypothetical protein
LQKLAVLDRVRGAPRLCESHRCEQGNHHQRDSIAAFLNLTNQRHILLFVTALSGEVLRGRYISLAPKWLQTNA